MLLLLLLLLLLLGKVGGGVVSGGVDCCHDRRHHALRNIEGSGPRLRLERLLTSSLGVHGNPGGSRRAPVMTGLAASVDVVVRPAEPVFGPRSVAMVTGCRGRFPSRRTRHGRHGGGMARHQRRVWRRRGWRPRRTHSRNRTRDDQGEREGGTLLSPLPPETKIIVIHMIANR